MSSLDDLDADDLTPPCIGERLRDAALSMTHPSATAVVVSLGAARLRHAAEETQDEQLALHAILECARFRDSKAHEIDAAQAAALVELRQGRSIAWAIQAGKAHLPVARNRVRRATTRPPSAG